jgi:triphosphoribosyl-dephospho-CoA synthase
MREAAGRDRIAFQYASGFADIFGLGLPALIRAREKNWEAPWPAVAAYLDFLAAFPDSHILRKHGAETAAAVQEEGVRMREIFLQAPAPENSLSSLLAFDENLKTRGLNPGTSADLTVAALFADRLSRLGG